MELVNNLEQPSYVVEFVETSLTAEHYSVMYEETAVLGWMEVHHWYQLVGGPCLMGAPHGVASSGGLNIHCFELVEN